MINITFPSITLQKVSNGWIIQWTITRGGTIRAKSVEAVALSPESLLGLINQAAKEIEND